MHGIPYPNTRLLWSPKLVVPGLVYTVRAMAEPVGPLAVT